MTDAGPLLSAERVFLTDALAEQDAAAFVHVSNGTDPTARYLLGRDLDRSHAFVATPDEAIVCVPDDLRLSLETVAVDTIHTFAPTTQTGAFAANLLDDVGIPAGATVLAPRHVPHDAALYLERAGYDLTSTTAVEAARAIKTDAELDRLRRGQEAAVAAMSHAATLLAEASIDGDQLVQTGDPLSPARLRREMNATLAQQGVSDAGNTQILVGADSTPQTQSTQAIESGQLVHVDLAPRGPDGYHGRLARTFVADGEGGWERRAHVAVTASRRVALGEIQPGEPARAVRTESVAELGSFGFTPEANSEGARALADAGSGVGLTMREAPSLRSDTPLESGHVLAIAPGVSHPSHGTVRTVDLVYVTDDGAEYLAEMTPSLVPEQI